MRIIVNLATRPYVELDRIFLQLRIAIGVLTLLALGMVYWLHLRSAQARVERAQIEQIQARTAALQTERSRNEARLRQPVNAAVLQQIDFLNGLYQRKSFSWTAVLMDLEEVLPSGLQVTSIDPQIATNGEVSIRMRVSGPRDRSVQLVRNLEASHRFIAPRLVGEAQQQQEKGSGVAVPAAYLSGNAAQAAAQNGGQALSGGNSGAGGAVVPPVDFDIVAGYNPLQPRIREHIAKAKVEEAATEEGAAQ